MDSWYCIDNGAMIAYAGYLLYNTGYWDDMDSAFYT